MSRKKHIVPLEVDRKTMKQLTKDHDAFMKGRNEDRQVDNEDPKEKFDNLLKKAAKK